MENELSAIVSSENPVSIDMQLGRTVNYATQQNDVPVIHSLRVRNTTDSVLQDVRVSVNTEPAFAAPVDRTIASIDPGETYNLGTLDLALSHDFLFQLTERILGTVHVTVTTTEGVVRTGEKVALLAYDEWSGLNGIPEILAAFVLPNHPAIEAILATAASILQQWTGDASLSGYQSKDRNRVAVMSAAVYTALQRSGIHYINPPASFEESGQKIRTPDRILDNKLGTCLDLAVLTAACLEQAGLYPLISFTTGHAFAGVWLEDECFPDCSTDDVLRLRKRAELGEVCVFETTLITSDPPAPFEQAVKEARRLLDDPEVFRCTVDICRSRKSRIRPLPLRSGIVGASGPASPPHAGEPGQQAPAIPFLTDAAPDAAGAPAEEAPTSRLDRWKRKLLDLTMHNRLLNFRETRKTLPVLCPDLAFLEDALADGAAFRLYPRPTDLDDSQPRDAEVHRLRTGDDAFDELLREEFRAHRLRADVTDAEVSRRLVEIYREARTSLEENGANTLYLALGFLSWYESATSTQQHLAPIILIPLDIERRSVQEGFSINQGDDDPMVNVTLLELLEHDFELSIPGMDPIPQDEHGINVQGILTAFRKAVKKIDRWEVLEKACIGHFSFTKFLMWRDLEVRTEDIQRSKVVSHLINTPHEQYASDGDLPDPDALDDTHRPSEMFCPVEADSSQLAAVCAAAEGKSFVLHGPPGTGKSQTITNLIAHALANGKSVLFVSEKMAALSVVHRRLVKSGLGAFCLTLHSNKSRKTEVVDQLGQALDGVATNSSESWLREANRLAALRDELNAYVRALHRVQETGESLFQGMSQLIGLRDVAHVPIGWPADRKVNRDTLDRLRDVVSQLEVAASASTHPDQSVWAPVSNEGWSPAWRSEVESTLGQLRTRCDELRESARAIGALVGMGADGWSERDLRALSSISKALLDSPATPAAMMTAANWDSLSTSISEWIAQGLHRDELRGQLYTKYATKLLQPDVGGLVRSALEPVSPLCSALRARTEAISSILGMRSSGWSNEELNLLVDICTALLGSPAVPTSMMTAPDWPNLYSEVEAWIEHGRHRNDLRAQLYSRYTDKLLQLDLDRLAERLAKADKAWFLPRTIGRKGVRRALTRVAKPGQQVDELGMSEDLVAASILRDEENYIDGVSARAGSLLCQYWLEGEADWSAVARVLESATRLRSLAEQAAAGNGERAGLLKLKWAGLVDERHSQLTPVGPIGLALTQYVNGAVAFLAEIGHVESALELNAHSAWIETKSAAYLEILLADIEKARALSDAQNYIIRISDEARAQLGHYWHDGEADWNAVAQMRDTASALRKLAAQIAGSSIERTSALRQQWSQLVSEGHEQLSAEGSIGRLLQDYIGKAQAFADARSTLESALSLDVPAAWGDASESNHLGTVAGHIGEWSAHLDELRSWCHWRTVRHQATDLRLDALVEAYEQGGLPSVRIPEAFQRSFYQWWVDQVTDREPTLRAFFSKEFERKIQQFREADEQYTDLTRSEVQARLAARLPSGGQAANQNSEMGILHRERQKQRRHMPIRQLLQKIPNLLPRLKPCLLMSPISVAQYLDPAHPAFDLVVFDEASQMPVWDAVGAIARGHETVIVGDPKQLPPTSFFARSDDPEMADDDVVEDLESILDDCLAARLPELHLRWHYRSRHESLIAFSNYHYYGNRLLTFPSPSQEPSVSLRPVRGVYDKSKSRTNRAEAEAVIAEVLRRLRDPKLSELSIGIVTFSISQQGLIEDLLDEARRTNPEIEAHFDSPTAPNSEPVFVKNLESVQGDERDAILFSICYGPDVQGRISMNFGPMNRDGGERRLNVAITRARREVIVFSSLRAEQIDLSRTRARGAADLKSFLDYAERGPAALAEQCTANPEAKCESIFELQVCEALRNKGHIVHSQVGCSGYRIDLAVVDPERPGRYLLGIECDGANYHRAKTARDRDRLREVVLKGLGWRLHRVWSTDWWEKPDAELARIEAAIEKAKHTPAQTGEQVRFASAPQQAVTSPGPVRDEQIQAFRPPAVADSLVRYESYKASKVLGDLAAFYEPYADGMIKQVIENVVKCEGPISLGLASRRVAAHWGIGKVGSKVAERISQIASYANVARTTSQKRVFLWRPEVTPDHYRIFRVPGEDDASRRGAEDLPPEEIANAAMRVLKSQISLPVDDLVSETARIFGFARTGHTVAHSVRLGIEMLLKRGDAIEQDGVITHRL